MNFEMEAYTSNLGLLTHSLFSPHNALLSHLKLVPGFRAFSFLCGCGGFSGSNHYFFVYVTPYCLKKMQDGRGGWGASLFPTILYVFPFEAILFWIHTVKCILLKKYLLFKSFVLASVDKT